MAVFDVVIKTYHFSPFRNPSSCNNAVRTHTAVYRFQLSQALQVTGGVDVETWQLLSDAG
jgi:hypothetical protein